MKKSLIFVLTALAMASCTDETYVGENFENTTGSKEIIFTSTKNVVTRANTTGADAATLLGNQFNVYGVKNTGSNTYKQVFNNYGLWYVAGSQSESNQKGWEYVTNTEVTPASANNELSTAITRQKVPSGQYIKYWDYSASDYWFYAISAANVTTQNSEKEDYKWYDSGQTPAEASNSSTTQISKCVINHVGEDNSVYYADAVKHVKTQSNNGSTTFADNKVPNQTELATNVDQEIVKFTFKRLQSKVRIGFYETVPGYAVNDVKFYPAASLTASKAVGFDTSSAVDVKIVTNATASSESKLSSGFLPATGQTYTITYDASTGAASLTNTTDNLTYGADKAFGKLNYTVARDLDGTSGNEYYMGETSITPTWAVAGTPNNSTTVTASSPYTGSALNNYWYVLPNESQYAAFKIKVDYTLTSIDGSKETIKVTGAEAVVPKEYCQWKGNYAYTYLFKISDNTNGTTGTATTDPKGLYPITFDACVVEFADGTQGTTTQISDYAITTYQEGSVTDAGIVYNASKAIDVTILSNTGVAATVGSNTNDPSAWYVYTAANGIATKSSINSLSNGKFSIAANDVKAGVYAISYKWHDGTKWVVTTKYVKVGAAGSVADEAAVNDVVENATLQNTNNTFTLPVGATLVKIYPKGTSTTAESISPSNGVYTITKDVDVYYNLGKTQYKATVELYTLTLSTNSFTSGTQGTSTITFKKGSTDVTSPTVTITKSDGTVQDKITVSTSTITVANNTPAGTYTVTAKDGENATMTAEITVNTAGGGGTAKRR